ncbi:hypothetical protein J7E88_01565 [Streptomyces sp. ISL-10]|nr:hypothetical protein [Streptomyces sp. ISL-10]
MLSACTATPAADNAAENRPIVDKSNWPEAVPERGLTKGLTLPLEFYMVSYADYVAIEEATTTLQQQCMADYGFQGIVFPQPGANPPPSDNDANIERRYGITDRTMAEKYGYGLPEELTRHTDQKMPDLTGVQFEVLTGHTKPEMPKPPKGAKDGSYLGAPTTKPARAEHNGKKLHVGGCIGWSKKKVALHEEDTVVVSNLSGESLTASMTSAPVQAVIKDWAACMKTKGHTLANPYKAMDQGVSEADPQKSITLALHDLACKEKTKLIQVWFDEESTIQKQAIKDHSTELKAVKSRHALTMTAARSYG